MDKLIIYPKVKWRKILEDNIIKMENEPIVGKTKEQREEDKFQEQFMERLKENMELEEEMTNADLYGLKTAINIRSW